MKLRVSVFCLVLLTACTPRGAITLDPAAATVGAVQHIFVATTRKRDPDGSFGSHRSEEMTFAQYDISIPPNRLVGDIKYPPRGGRIDPTTQFLTTNELVYSSDVPFRQNLKQALAANGGEAVIFVHGYNNNFPESLYRVAQFAHDLKIPGVVVNYSWPSAAEALGYVYDRDSALFARDGLDQLIQEVAKSGARRILLVAHSMGSGLTMEALRSSALRGDARTLQLIGGVILISPDIDVDVFREEARTVGTLPQPFVIFGSNRDKALRLSAALTGQAERLGSLTDVSRLADLKVTFLDVRAFVEGAGHFAVGDSASLILLLDRIGDIQGAFEADRRARIGLLPGVVLTVQNATQIILRPLETIATDISR